MKLLYTVLLTTSLLSVSLNSMAQTFKSPAKKVPLIELYTSEGCSSCPPAERWLSSLIEHENLWTEFVPIAFHVDYWDYLGWKDPYANKANSQRQRRYAREFNASTVYTPGMRKEGLEWRSWKRGESPLSPENDEVGVVSISVDENRNFEASFTSDQIDSNNISLNVALLGLDITSEVTRGENHGKTLEHEFVVLGISSFAGAENGKWTGQLPDPQVETPKYAVAAWITDGQSLIPIQATGGFLEDYLVSKAN